MPGLADSPRWSLLAADAAAEKDLVDELGLDPLVARVLASRGIKTAEDARTFLSPSLDRDWADPLDIPGMAEVADRVQQAIEGGEQIAVFGDFDVDGMSATCLLTLGLRRLGARVEPYIPHRFGEGYGLSPEALDRVVAGCDPSLIITVDNGIAAANEVKDLLARGIDVVITDHHEPADLVPQGVPVTDPKLVEDCYSRELAGAGVALKLLDELGRRLGQPDLWRSYVDVATLGTLSDMMLLVGENRALVAEGIARMRRTTRPGLVALAATAGIDIAQVTADNLPFNIIPRLNAAGRMGTTDVAFDLLMVEDPYEATILAGKLEEINANRREVEAQLSDQAMAKIAQEGKVGHCVVVGGEGWHEGVKGIVASRIVNRYHVPAIIFTISDGIARGSGRSVGSVDLFHAVEQCADVLVRFGGHAGAVGVTCEASRLPEFRDRLEAVLSQLDPKKFEDTGEVTARVDLCEITVESIGALEALQPFGQGNKKPLFACCAVSMKNRGRVGADASHLRFIATDGAASVPAIMFRAPRVDYLADYEGAVDVVFEAVNESWQGRVKPKLMVKDVLIRDAEKPAGAAAGPQGAAAPAPALADDLEAQLAAAPGAGDAHPARPADPAPSQATRQELARLSYAQLTDALVRRMIGENPLLPAQAAALDCLAAGKSCLSVMATGRGKSLIFHVHAAREAILNHRASIFVYPLRALVQDQSFHLARALADLGVTVQVITGESSQEARTKVFSALASHTLDVVLTTPEFLAIHAAEFATGNIGFLAIDEAHHAGMSKSGNRSAYASLPQVRETLGNPVCLAVSATVTTDVAQETCRLLGIAPNCVLSDHALRPNLRVADGRGYKDRDSALVNLVSSGEKCVVYVTSRDQSVTLCRMLRHRIPELASKVAFYNAGLDRPTRCRVEAAFRAGDLTCIVSTSAFGEGVNLPDIRHVVLYGMPFGRVDFNQMSGRAGRDGQEAQVHMFFNAYDTGINQRLIGTMAPPRDTMIELYRALRTLTQDAAQPVALDPKAFVDAARAKNPRAALDAAQVEPGLGVFEELGFVSISGIADQRRVSLVPNPVRMELTRSVRYLEGMHQREEFDSFAAWALDCPADELLARIVRPITPNFGKRMGEGK